MLNKERFQYFDVCISNTPYQVPIFAYFAKSHTQLFNIHLDLFPFNVQTPGTLSLPSYLHPNFPTRICATAIRQAWFRSLFTPLSQYANVGNSNAHYENRMLWHYE